MFKSARWRTEKIKIVFKLQFHATQVGVQPLILSVIPANVGKPTARLEKTSVRDGSCYWDNPVYETVKFVRELKTGKIHERNYHFIVSRGSSKAGLVGEVLFDFADYVEATKPSCVSLAFKNSNSGAILHVSIQKMMQENIDQRVIEDIVDVRDNPEDGTLKTLLSKGDTDENIKSNFTQDTPLDKTTSHIVDLNGNANRRASSESDITVSSSESSSGLNTPRELGLQNINMHQDPTSFLSSLNDNSVCQKPTANASIAIDQEHQRSQCEWSVGSDHGASTDNLTNSSQDTLSGHGYLDSDIDIGKLKTDLIVLARQAEVSDLELQTLRKQVVKESKRGQDLAREVVSLKEERDTLKEECEKFKKSQKEAKARNKLQSEGGDPRALIEELRQELNYEKDLNANLRVQLQKTLESNSELILAVQDLDEMLEQKNRETSTFSSKSVINENQMVLQDSDADEEQKALEELVKEHTDAKDAYLLEQRITDLSSELEFYRRDKDELEMQMEQLALDYEILKQENHDIAYKLEQSEVQEQLKIQYECSGFSTINELETQIENLENQLKKQTKEFSDALSTISELETHAKSLEQELEKQAEGFEADLEALTCAKVEQEQRAIKAEEALRNARWKNVNTAERLQDEFRRLSMQMASTFDANEKLAVKALTEASELRVQKSRLEEMLQKANEELQSAREDYEEKLRQLSHEINLKASQREEILFEIEDKSKQLELQKSREEKMQRDLSQEILMLRTEIDRLTTENKALSKQGDNLNGELERMRTSIKETELLLKQGDMERNELESSIALARKQVEKSLKELNSMKALKDDKERLLENLQSELETLREQYNLSKHSLFEDELEKEKLQKQVFQLKGDLKHKEDAYTTLEKKLKDSYGRATMVNGAKVLPRNNKAVQEPRGSKELTNLREKIKLLEGQIKLKETTLEKSTHLFLEKETDLQNKIEELESRMEELNQNSRSLSEHELQKVARDNARDQENLDELLSEMALLKERNKSMEVELKEMQERYSEISLKFAEVEGERQQLVMTVRYLKNTKKS